MDGTPAAFAILVGLAVRLAIPILVTALVVFVLRQLDARWQSEARIKPLKVEKPKCWKVQGCTPAKRKDCPGAKSPLPCWQVFRLPSGYLDEKCLGCKVFVEAPMPARA
jgi:hypothetical protein